MSTKHARPASKRNERIFPLNLRERTAARTYAVIESTQPDVCGVHCTPLNALELIVKHLPYPDLLSMRAVCKGFGAIVRKLGGLTLYVDCYAMDAVRPVASREQCDRYARGIRTIIEEVPELSYIALRSHRHALDFVRCRTVQRALRHVVTSLKHRRANAKKCAWDVNSCYTRDPVLCLPMIAVRGVGTTTPAAAASLLFNDARQRIELGDTRVFISGDLRFRPDIEFTSDMDEETLIFYEYHFQRHDKAVSLFDEVIKNLVTNVSEEERKRRIAWYDKHGSHGHVPEPPLAWFNKL